MLYQQKYILEQHILQEKMNISLNFFNKNKDMFVGLNKRRKRLINDLTAFLEKNNINIKMFQPTFENLLEKDKKDIEEYTKTKDKTILKKVITNSGKVLDKIISNVLGSNKSIDKKFLPAIPIILKVLYLLVYAIPVFGRIILGIFSAFSFVLLPLLVASIGAACLFFLPLFNELKDVLTSESNFRIFSFFMTFDIIKYTAKVIAFYKEFISVKYEELSNLFENGSIIVSDIIGYLIDVF